MAIRTFTDMRGTRWQVWSVVPPPSGERRGGRQRRLVAKDPPGPERRMLPERRRNPDRRSEGAESGRGWLCFESGSEKKRLAPVPPAWEQLAEEELEALAHRARTLLRRGRR